jgi:adenine-specific DNA-methyltransferase
MTIQKLRPTFTFTEDRLRELQQVVPEAFADGKINWETLREALGEVLEDETQEHFGLTWPGKREARRLAALPPQGTLVPARGEGVDEETTHNLFIEGENLEALKLLQKSYAGRVKMIYIDPPYNTGNDFIYEDDYSEPLEAYLKRTGQMDEAGRRLTTNTRASGRFHSKWLSMIYPRLLLARQLLREDGVIFVSIDDNEVHHLRQVMDEVFGEENFVGQLIIKSNPRGRQSERFFATVHEYVLVFAKNTDESVIRGQSLSESAAISEYKFLDEGGKRYRLLGLRQRGAASRRVDRPNMFYPIYVDPHTGKISLEKNNNSMVEVFPRKSTGEDGRWMWSRNKVKTNLHLLEAKLVSTRQEWDIFVRDYLDTDTTRKQKTILDDKEINYQNGTTVLKALFETTQAFMDFPKPLALLKTVLEIGGLEDNDIVLDFFAGSCTTAHAVLAQNREDGGRRQFIMVQLPEPTPPDSEARKAGYATIAEIGKERIRRVIRKMKEEQNGQLPLPATEDGQPSPLDLGFKVLKLTRSHFKPWAPLPPTDAQTLDSLFEQNISPLVSDWRKEGLLSEILLLEGFPLDSRIIPLEGIGENDFWRVHHEDVGHELFICLDEKIQPATVERLKSGEILRRDDLFICLDEKIQPATVERLKSGEILRRDDLFICLDSALTDEAKVVLDDRLRLKVI